jgi:ribonuclease HI
MKEVVGYEPKTTNNRMELRAVIEAIKHLKTPCNITVRTDSKYICNGIACAKEREANGWHTKTGARCANTDLWIELGKLRASGKHVIQCTHVEGHSGDPDNEECDRLAKLQILLNEG